MGPVTELIILYFAVGLETKLRLNAQLAVGQVRGLMVHFAETLKRFCSQRCHFRKGHIFDKNTNSLNKERLRWRLGKQRKHQSTLNHGHYKTINPLELGRNELLISVGRNGVFVT